MRKLLFLAILCLTGHLLFAQEQARDILKQKATRQLEDIIDKSPTLVGVAAVDLGTGDGFAVNADLVFAQASAIKIPILMEVFKQVHEKKFALSDLKPLLPVNTVGGSGILNAMTGPVNLSIMNYCILMISLSDNSATNTLIDLVGMSSINNTMAGLGLKNTRVQRKMIDQPASLRNEENISTPAEALKIMRMLHDGKFINREISDEILSILKKNPLENSKLSKGLPANIKLAFKPGGMGGVSTEWAIVYFGKRPYALTVMENYKSGSSSAPDAFSALSEVLYNYYSRTSKATKYGVILE